MQAWNVQKAFRSIHDLYDERVVFVTTEQTVKVQSNPFFDDPLFNQMFGNQGNLGRQPRTQKRTGLGSGFIISDDGYIATNNHVVEGADKVTVRIGTKDYKADVIGKDERTDVALIKISSSRNSNPYFSVIQIRFRSAIGRLQSGILWAFQYLYRWRCQCGRPE